MFTTLLFKYNGLVKAHLIRIIIYIQLKRTFLHKKTSKNKKSQAINEIVELIR